jgi:hypothetical protein
MQEEKIYTRSAGFYAWAASRDAAIKSYVASTGYTDAQKLRAERVKLGLELVYNNRAVRINYRAKWITLKVEGASVRDSRSLALLEADYVAQGITKRVNLEGDVLYKILKG